MEACNGKMSGNRISGNDGRGMQGEATHRKYENEIGCGFRAFKELYHADDGGSKVEGEAELKEEYAHQKQPSSQSMIFMPSSFAVLPTSRYSIFSSSAIALATVQGILPFSER